MGQIVLFALLSAVYPTLIAATTVMLLLPRAEALMLGFWLGAMITSVACGLVIVLSLHQTPAVKTTSHRISPALDLVFAAFLVVAAIVLEKGEDRRMRERHAGRHPKAEKMPTWRRKLQDGNPWHSFVVAILLSFPGVWYLAALDRLSKLHYSTPAEILVVIGFCLAQLVLIEVPMLAFKVWPRRTPMAINSAKRWGSRHGRQYGVWGLAILAGLLVLRGVIGVLR